MKKKLLATAIAGALVAPGAFAAQDTSGMRYTSASEGFYASIRAQFSSGSESSDAAGNVIDNGAAIENSASRFGVRGSNDLGGGLAGFYQYEAGVGIDDGGGLSTRLAHVGLRGGFGNLQVGSFWPQSYNWVHGSTDVANWASGNFLHVTLLPGRQSRALEYTTPDLNGFQASGFFEMSSGADGAGGIAPDTRDVLQPGDANYARAVADDIVATGGRNLVFQLVEVAPVARTATGDGMPMYFDAASGGGEANLDETPLTGNALALVIQNHLSGGGGYETEEGDDGRSYTFLDTRTGTGFDGLSAGDAVVTSVEVGSAGNPKDDTDIDLWSLSAKYSIQGFDAGVSYTVRPDGLEKRSGSRADKDLYALRLGYSQNNWYVTSWYSQDNASDGVGTKEGVKIPIANDTETFSIAAGVAVGKVNLYAVYEQQERDNEEGRDRIAEVTAATQTILTPIAAEVAAVPSGTNTDEYTTFGVQYNLGSRSRVWVEYAGRDLETDTAVEDTINIGMRHDF